MRRRSSPSSSFELFLDTICNTFGGILFIAILIAIQIRQTEGRIETPLESASPEKIAELQQKLENIVSEIESAKDLREIVRKTMPEPANEDAGNQLNRYNELTEIKTKKLAEKTELTEEYFTLNRQNVELEQKIKENESRLQNYETEKETLETAIKEIKIDSARLEHTITTLKNNIDDLTQKISQKESDKNTEDNLNTKIRREKVSVTTLYDTEDYKMQAGFMLRYNRLYCVSNRSDFNFSTDEFIGKPKPDHGIPLNDSAECRRQIINLLKHYTPASFYIAAITYRDSFDYFYIFRDIISEKGFEIQILPSSDNNIWLRSGGKRGQVQ
jgi:hypothetical protein